MKRFLSVFVLAFIGFLFPELLAQQIAFPGAEGFGKYASGGRGGRIVEVTNLKDLDRNGQTEAGSFRAAVNTPGDDPITVVFKVSGTVELNAELKSKRSNMTIAGQTAPGDGICIKDHTIKLSGNNLIIRYVRFRPGDLLGAETSGLNIENAKNIIIDHCSMSWSVEENTAFYDNVNTTVQWCIISEGLYNSHDPKGARSYGGQWGGQYSSYHHNLLAHNYSRAPRINGSRAHDTLALVDFRNNVIYNWGRAGAVYGGEEEITNGFCKTNMINNYYKPGPATSSKLLFAEPSYESGEGRAKGYAEWYFDGNYMEGVEGGMNDDNWLGVDTRRVGSAENIKSEYWFPVEPITTQTAQEAYELVLEKAGAILPVRDPVDRRIVAETRGEIDPIGDGIIDSQSEVGGWPAYESTEAPADTDKDGMPDTWETEKGFDPEDPEDGKIIAEGGFTNFEIYLNSLAAESEEEEDDEEVLSVDPDKSTGFKVYPNPARDTVFFSSPSIVEVTIHSLAGNLLLTQKVQGNSSITVSTLEKGVYIATLKSDNQYQFVKLIKE